MIERLFANLHPALNRDPLPVLSLKITNSTPTTIIVRNGYMQISGYKTFDLSTTTIVNLATQIAQLTGFTSSSVAYGSLSALALIDGTYTSTCTVPIFTSPLWAVLRTISQSLKQMRSDGTQALFQAIPNTAVGIWLDELGTLYGVTREPGEPDQLYAVRVFDFSLEIRLNNIAIEKILNDLGYPSTVVDTPPHAFKVNVTLPSVAPQGFVYSVAGLSDLVDKLRADGVQATIVLDGTLQDTVHISDSLSITGVQETWTWANFPGANGWIGFSW